CGCYAPGAIIHQPVTSQFAAELHAGSAPHLRRGGHPCPAAWISRTLGIITFASKRGSPVPILRLLPAPLIILVFATAAFAVVLSPAGWAKDTGLVFVSNEKTNNLIVIDPKTNKVVKDLRTSRRPRDMHFNADHTKLYVACGDDDVIDIIDVAKLEVIGKLST